MARDHDRNAATAHALYAFFVYGKRAPAMIVAERMGIAYSTLAAYWGNAEDLPAHRVKALAHALRGLVPEAEIAALVSNVIGAGDVGLTVSADPVESSPDSVRDHALKLGAAVGAAQSTVLRALEDNDVNDVEADAIAQAVEEVQRQGETLCKASKLKVAK